MSPLRKTAPTFNLKVFRPDDRAEISMHVHLGGDEAVKSLSTGDGGLGRDATEELLVRLRKECGLACSVPSHDLENLVLETR